MSKWSPSDAEIRFALIEANAGFPPEKLSAGELRAFYALLRTKERATPHTEAVPERSKPTDQQWTPNEVDMLKDSKQEPLVLNTIRREQADSSAAQMPVAVNRAFLKRTLSAMEGVIDVADRKTDEFDALRSCVVDLTLMLHATQHTEAVRMSEAEIIDIAKNPMTAPCSPWWLKDDVVLGDVRNAAIVFARAVEQATAARLGVKLGDV